MRTIALFICLSVIVSPAFAQDSEGIDVESVSILTVFNPGFSHEIKIGRYQTFYGQIFMNTSIYLGYSSALGNMSDISFEPAITGQYRYYYNAQRRADKGKRTALNSMNYLSFIYEATFTDERVDVSDYDEEKVRPIHQLGICWGIQRNYASRFSLNLNLGVGYFYTRVTTPDATGQPVSGHNSGLNTIGQINLGIWLNKRK